MKLVFETLVVVTLEGTVNACAMPLQYMPWHA